MQDLIEKLYNGELFPAQEINPLLQDYKSKHRLSSKLRDKFEKTLPEQLKADYEEVMISQAELASLETTQAFVDGYKIGARFIIEILSEEKKDVEN